MKAFVGYLGRDDGLEVAEYMMFGIWEFLGEFPLASHDIVV